MTLCRRRGHRAEEAQVVEDSVAGTDASLNIRTGVIRSIHGVYKYHRGEAF